ncbi:MAG: hypothetical protein U9O78_00040 [Patescibacteria group bacterium]|nr:hypothetical protein [Patescibacteria group bacterium]
MKKIEFRLVSYFVIIFYAFTLFHPSPTLAKPHYTVIINQVRGDSCCQPGSVKNLKQQLEYLQNNNLTANFVLRYDALFQPEIITKLKNSNHQIGAYLEIIPSLTQAAAITHQSDETKWYQAQNAYLVGYSQEQRQKIIDVYMNKFQQELGYYPQLTTAWMIDAWSLSYLKKQYGVLVHQITREQFGTDSYTLSGGPPHYPYWPNSNWALIPNATKNTTMPLIVRQTISDPVYNYGDQSNSYTSQPNDYLLREASTTYFKHLFLQAHNQPQANLTFALLGLENSMTDNIQQEFAKQLDFVGQWQNEAENQVINASAFYHWYRQNYQPSFIYQGQNQNEPAEKAWWLTTDNYRLRVRLSDHNLFIADIRIYDPNLEGPYFAKQANLLGWWIVPYVLDGSRFLADGAGVETNFFTSSNDYLLNRQAKLGEPSQILLASDVNADNLQSEKNNEYFEIRLADKVLLKANEDSFCFVSEDEADQSTAKQAPALAKVMGNLNKLTWVDREGHFQWGLQPISATPSSSSISAILSSSSTPSNSETPSNSSDSYLKCFVPKIDPRNFTKQRDMYPQLLFPELKIQNISAEKTNASLNNRWAVAQRNPLRLVVAPRDDGDNMVLAKEKIEVKTEPATDITINTPNPENGLVFIDLNHPQPSKVEIHLSLGSFAQNLTGYFVPNCYDDKLYCLTHPRQTWWFVQNWLGDKARQKQEEIDKAAQFID